MKAGAQNNAQESMSRRTFLSIGATAAALAAGAGLAGCAPQAREATTYGEANGTTGTATVHNVTDTSWMEQPEEATSFVQEYDCDVVVCGLGYAGTTACRELAEQGKSVIAIDKQPQDSFAATGNEFGALNAAVLKDRGVPEIDPVDFYQNFMKITSNMPNPSLVMKFAQNSEENTNWYLSPLSDEDLATMTTAFFPTTEHQLSELSGIKFWASVCSFYGECNQTRILSLNQEVAQENGAQIMFGTTGSYLVMEDGAVSGLVASTSDGSIKFNCKAVVIACGGMGGNIPMMTYFMPDMAQALVEGESLSSMSANDGSGVQMAYWAGAHLETAPIAGMNMKGLSVPGKMNCLPQAVWVDDTGKRFCNEYYPTSEQRGYQNVFTKRTAKFAVCDDNFTEYRQYTLPQHGGFEASEENISSLRESLDTAYAQFQGTSTSSEQAGDDAEGAGGPVTSVEYIADDTLEGLAEQMGLEGDAITEFVSQIERYNSYCDNGADLEFGRDAQVLFPVRQAPFYACSFTPELGETMVTMGGIITDGDQNALDQNYEPIPGLYVSGNDCGRRFGMEYITPIPGLSIGFAMVLGRECGKSVAAYIG